MTCDRSLGFISQRVFLARDMVRSNGQDSIGDPECIPFRVSVDLRFAVAMSILADPHIVYSLPLFSVQPGSVKFILPDESVGFVQVMCIAQRRDAYCNCWRLPGGRIGTMTSWDSEEYHQNGCRPCQAG